MRRVLFPGRRSKQLYIIFRFRP